jgi:hypothetical protein
VSAAAISSELQRRGVSVRADGDALILKPRRAVDSELLARVRKLKPEIIRALSARPATCAATCYEVERGRRIHHQWNGCAAPMPPTEATQTIEQSCWHCGGSGECDCSTCGVMRPAVVWTAGECVACKVRKTRVQ